MVPWNRNTGTPPPPPPPPPPCLMYTLKRIYIYIYMYIVSDDNTRTDILSHWLRFIDEIAMHSYLPYTLFNTLRPRQDG